jgi:hypothetical protein
MRLETLRKSQALDVPARLKSCRKVIAFGEWDAYFVEQQGHIGLRGLARCESSWSCPYCSPFNAHATAERVEDTLANLIRAGYHLHFVTLTCRHTLDDPLKWLLEQFTQARRTLWSSRGWRDLAQQYGFLGTFRAWEVTHGYCGWHAHTHEFLPVRERIPNLVDWYPSAWAHACESAGLYASKSHGTIVCDVNPATLARASYYATGWGAATESAGMPFKTARAGNKTVWQLLDEAIAGDDHASALWSEYTFTTRGRKRLSWSGKLKSLIAPPRQPTLNFTAPIEHLEFTQAQWIYMYRRALDIRLLKALSVPDLDEAQRIRDFVYQHTW